MLQVWVVGHGTVHVELSSFTRKPDPQSHNDSVVWSSIWCSGTSEESWLEEASAAVPGAPVIDCVCWGPSIYAIVAHASPV